MNRWTGRLALAIGGATIAPGAAIAQQEKPAVPVQTVIPPKTVYLLSAATSSGFGMTGGKPLSAGEMMRMAMGGGNSEPSKSL